MDCLLWKSFAQSESISVSRQLQNGESPSATSSLQTLLIILACSHLVDLAIRARIYPDLGTPLGAGANILRGEEASPRKVVCGCEAHYPRPMSISWFLVPPSRDQA